MEPNVCQILASACQLTDSASQNGMPHAARDLGQRHQDESALVHPRVRNHEIRLVDSLRAEQQQIEIERSRHPALLRVAHTTRSTVCSTASSPRAVRSTASSAVAFR